MVQDKRLELLRRGQRTLNPPCLPIPPILRLKVAFRSANHHLTNYSEYFPRSTAAFNPLLGLKNGTRLAGIGTGTLALGFLPTLGARSLASKTPSSVSLIVSPADKVSMMI